MFNFEIVPTSKKDHFNLSVECGQNTPEYLCLQHFSSVKEACEDVAKVGVRWGTHIDPFHDGIGDVSNVHCLI